VNIKLGKEELIRIDVLVKQIKGERKTESGIKLVNG